MRLQQLRYLLAVADAGSISVAAKREYVSQSTVSVAIKELETEMGVTIFRRSSKGISLTNEGLDLLGYARQVVDQADLMLDRFSKGHERSARRLSVSSQHYGFVASAFARFLNEQGGKPGEFVLRETRTNEIIRDVADFRSSLGFIYLDDRNGSMLRRRLDEEQLVFTPLFSAQTHVFVRAGHPLASQRRVSEEDLAGYPCFRFEQGPDASLYYSEEPLFSERAATTVVVSDRATMTTILRATDGYLVSTGVIPSDIGGDVVAIPLESSTTMEVGYLTHKERQLGSLAQEYLGLVREALASVRSAGPTE